MSTDRGFEGESLPVCPTDVDLIRGQLATHALSAEISIEGCESDRQCVDGALCEVDTLTFPGSPNSIRQGSCVLRDKNGINSMFAQGGVFLKDGWRPEGKWDRLNHIDEKVRYVQQMMATHKPIDGFIWGKRPNRFPVSIDSPGGNVYAAMQLGRLFRENLVSIKLNDTNAQCASSCIFAWVGANAAGF